MSTLLEYEYAPHAKQRELHDSKANEILFGGAAGPGKSHGLRHEGFHWACRIPRLQVYLFRRTFPELERNHIIPSFMEFPQDPVCQWREQKKRYDFRNGAMFHMCHCQHEKDVFQYQGAEIHILLMDELGTFTPFIYTYLRGRVRCTIDVPEKYKHKVPGIYCAANPGGPCHQFAKKTWVTFCKVGELKRAPKRDGGMVRQYIPGLLSDNPTMTEKDPTYVDRLDGLEEPYRTAYKEGNWDLFMGQMFSFNPETHVIPPMPVPKDATLYFTYDYGYAAPYSAGWWWVDADGRLYRFAELYGMRPGQPNVGLRQPDDLQAKLIVEHEARQGIDGRPITRLCDPTCFNKKPDYKGGGQGPSTAEIFAERGIVLQRADAARVLKIRQFHARLHVPRDKSGNPIDAPMLVVYNTCVDFIRTIPILESTVLNPEDVDKKLEDHCYDEAAQVCMARPLKRGAPPPPNAPGQDRGAKKRPKKR